MPNNELKNMLEEIAATKAKLKLTQKNLKFARLSPAKKRVAVVNDVLTMLAAPTKRRINVQADRVYCNLNTPGYDSLVDLQAFVTTNPQDCKVCAVGALFLAHARLFNNVKVTDEHAEYPEITETLSGYFSETQLGLIEAAFEGAFTDHTDQSAYRWREKFDSDDERLIAICKNIVRNGGTFKIHQVR